MAEEAGGGGGVGVGGVSDLSKNTRQEFAILNHFSF
jgi:hypothetical protein